MKQTRFAGITLSIALTLGLTFHLGASPVLSQVITESAIIETITPEPTVQSPLSPSYTVQIGDTLFKIAGRFGTTVEELIKLNPSISDSNVILVGQILILPGTEPDVSQTPDHLAPSSNENTDAVTATYDFAPGIEIFTSGQNIAELTTAVTSLGMQWVKHTIYWRDIEPVRGQIDFSALDEAVNHYASANLRVLFTVTAAPPWARTYILENGPPDNLADFGTFMTALTQRYAGRVHAYEIWNEPNRRSEWSCTEDPKNPRFCTARYIDLLNTAYQAVKLGDTRAVVVSAGLAPTGFNDGTNAADDRIFLTELYSAGLAQISDAIGAHPLGWANPPDSACCTAADGVLTHFEKPTFYFRNTVDEYRQIMLNAGDDGASMWITKFGWGTAQDTPAPSPNSIYVSYTDLEEQAAYDERAFALGAELGFVGPMFIDNLNGCQAAGDAERCFYSLIGPSGQVRPVFERLKTQIVGGLKPEGILPTAEIQSTPVPTPGG